MLWFVCGEKGEFSNTNPLQALDMVISTVNLYGLVNTIFNQRLPLHYTCKQLNKEPQPPNQYNSKGKCPFSYQNRLHTFNDKLNP